MRNLALLALAAVLAAPPPARADMDEKLVGVFPLETSGKPANPVQKKNLEDILVAKSVEFLRPEGYDVLPNQQFMETLQAKGRSQDLIAKACAEACVAEGARMVGLSLFLSGSITTDPEDGSVRVIVRINDVKRGSIVKAVSFSGDNLKRAIIDFEAKAPKFFHEALLDISPAYRKRVNDAKDAEKVRERARKADPVDDGEDEPPARKRGGVNPENPIADLGGRLIVRGGLGGLTGVLGAGVEWHTERFALGIGYGRYLTLGATFKPVAYLRHTKGGFYLDAHYARTITDPTPSSGFGATVGYDYRPVSWVSVKAGLGLAQSSLKTADGNARFWLADLSGGLVF